MSQCPFLSGTRGCLGEYCELWNEEESRCDFTSMAECLREICDSLTADKQPGEPVEGVLLETGLPIPEVDADVLGEQAIMHGWWDLFPGAVFEQVDAAVVADYWRQHGMDVRIEFGFSAGQEFYRLWLRRKKAA